MAGFLSRFHNSKFYPLLQRILRILQFLSALSSLIVFSIRIRKIYKLYRSISHAEGAIEGILVAAIVYTLAVMALKLCMRNGGPKFLRWVIIVLDIAFVGAFIAVAVLTSPNGGKAGPCYGQRKKIAAQNNYATDPGCQLPLGTFITAIVSTILHALTATFQDTRERHREHKAVKEEYYNRDNNSGLATTNPTNYNQDHSVV
ncbi:uncharacterized protein EAE98_002676 [Botrytis deweyae]|uniref:MARVEL domain-containing protein n=1 Tax=Botrytis deweyae TaxID=2478750 RepID=A0ABQ7IUN4_9HELO|nr:uncharacterized protein EAE98_002676 [Botrytis deweyae]KAF7934631.1 hypothetical protein EAE98_002676 [Botrytis deweyae]